MARLVLDASVAVKWVFPEAHSINALRIFDRYQRGLDELIAPDIFLAEVANAAWKKSVLLGEVTDREADVAVRSLAASCPSLVSSTLLVDQAFALARRFRRPVYDCLYVALALEERCDMVTADAPLTAAVGPALGCVRQLSSF